MAKETNKINSNAVTASLIVVALLVLGGIVYYSYTNKPVDSESAKVETKTEDVAVADVDKLGSREVALTPENYNEVTTKNKLVLADVYSPTCPHCQKIAPILTELSEEYGDKLVIGKMSVAIDANREFILNMDKSFEYVPSIFIYKDGQKVESFTGSRTKEEFKVLIDKYTN